MYRSPDPRTLIRPSWIKDLSAALSDAEKLLSTLEANGQYPVETVQLRIRIEKIRSEMELLDGAIRCGDRVVRSAWPTPAPDHARSI